MNRLRDPDRTDFIMLGLISGCGLTFEILLLRVFSYSQWHHFASIAVSLALLGFGIAGTCLTILRSRKWLLGDRFHIGGVFIAVFGMLLVCIVPHFIRTRPLFAVWDLHELAKLLVLDFTCLIPFWGMALSIGQVFIRWPEFTRKLYCANLVGSGLGALLPLVLLPFFYLESALLFAPMLLLAGVSLFSICHRRMRISGLTGLTGAILIGAWILAGPPKLPVSDFKQLSYFLDLPDARVLDRKPGLIEEMTLIRSDSIRIAPGLSLRWSEAVPSQDVAVIGSDSSIPLRREGVDTGYNSARLGHLPLLLRPDDKIAVLGTSDWLLAEQLDNRPAIWINEDAILFDIYSKYGLLEEVENRTQGYRSFLSSTRECYSVVYLNGAYAIKDSASVDYTLTKEGIHAAMNKLSKQGILAIPIRFEYPPRYSAKLTAMLYHVLAERGTADPTACIAILRSMQDALFIVAPDTWTISDIRMIRSFSSQWNFDLSALPGLKESETNQYNQLDEPVLYYTMQALHTGQSAIPTPVAWFSLKESSDSNPHFWRTVDWGQAFAFFKSIGRQSLVWMDWAILALVVKLLISAILAAILIILPLANLPFRKTSKSKISVFLYFACLGLGFLLLEIVIFQRCLLFVPQAVVAASLVFSVFLIGAGTGSLYTPNLQQPDARKSIFTTIILAAGLAYLVLYPGKNLLLRFDTTLLFLSLTVSTLPLAWSLGRAFPWGLRQLDQQREWIPWAWGINGFFSVIAAPTATLLSIHFNQSVTWSIAAACYLLAAFASRRWAIA